MNDPIPFPEVHRGVEIRQPHRVAMVKASVDAVFLISESAEPRFFWRSVAPLLFAYAKDAANPPEARLFAVEKIKQAARQQAVSDLEAA